MSLSGKNVAREGVWEKRQKKGRRNYLERGSGGEFFAPVQKHQSPPPPTPPGPPEVFATEKKSGKRGAYEFSKASEARGKSRS